MRQPHFPVMAVPGLDPGIDPAIYRALPDPRVKPGDDERGG
jgi:hypothetical protein